jgi:hypothetical protein
MNVVFLFETQIKSFYSFQQILFKPDKYHWSFTGQGSLCIKIRLKKLTNKTKKS